MNLLNNMGAFPNSKRPGVRASRVSSPRFLRLAAVAVAAALSASACALPHLSNLPHEKPTIPPLNQTSLLLDDNGRLITRLHAGENRTLIPLSEVPQVTRDAVIAAEDERFYQHHGIDAKAILRAFLQNAKNGKIVEGGSTITQQLVKNTITGNEQTFGR
jgi:membrane peptidoglycan carboxypeptidase